MTIAVELGKLQFFFERGRRIYKAYQLNGCTFFYARILKENNERIIESLSIIYAYCPKDVQSAILSLTFHIDVWSSCWLSLFDELKPTSNDKFVFENSVCYPQDAEKKIIAYSEVINNG